MPPVRHLTYESPGGLSDVEVMPFETLRALNDGQTQRADFHVIAIVTGGSGRVTIDFGAPHALVADTAVWIPPGAVHRWNDIATVEGTLVLFEPSVPMPAAVQALTDDLDREPVWRLDTCSPVVATAVAHLALEFAEPPENRPPDQLPLLLAALLGRLQLAASRRVQTDGDADTRGPVAAERPPTDGLAAAFRRSVEQHFALHHDVGFYARLLGYSSRTVTRAALRSTGRSAKTYINERIALEAKRLLAHDGVSAAACAAQLGFADPSNFGSFFREVVGESPAAWARARGSGPAR
ncbi:AraC family transcriptional regulator [Curtobacterium ammoniigenes]|uniref:AraC family transcriptional regulator n=1 Tax=Curtobacterium ammoniigenes TaxID=395387 RepID=UPI0012EEA159|nr:helix-turn-helix transcriptional regulator [Curtobacterium ammoniigenes]